MVIFVNFMQTHSSLFAYNEIGLNKADSNSTQFESGKVKIFLKRSLI